MKPDSSAPFDEKRYEKIRRREVDGGDTFFYGVITTGVYCRPGCGARTPNRENVIFFGSRQQAEQQGYRPCKKCRPELRRGSAPHEKEIILAEGMDVGAAIFSAGYSSLSGAYNKNDDRLAMTPKKFRQGGQDVHILYGSSPCYLGMVLVAATDRGICAVELGDSEEQVRAQLHRRFPRAEIKLGGPEFGKLIEAVVEQIDHPSQVFNLPLDIQGTAFQQQVWQALHTIEPGHTLSYRAIAEQIGRPSAARAVAGACAANKIAVLIPCHRVLAKDKKTSGYRWGRERKKLILGKEKKSKR